MVLLLLQVRVKLELAWWFLRSGLKEFMSTCVKNCTMYIWSSAMKRNFLKHLEIIAKKTGIHLSSYRIVDQSLCFRNDHFLLQKLDKPVFHKNIFFFVQFLRMMFENTLLIDDMLHNNLFNPPFSAIFCRRSTGRTMILITYSNPFFFIWNLCIQPKCEFINL
jgi:hypothetical protein